MMAENAQSRKERIKAEAKKINDARPKRGFPLFAHQCGQWAKKVDNRHVRFGSWGLEASDAQRKRLRDAALDAFKEYERERQAGKKTYRKDAAVGELVERFLQVKATEPAQGSDEPVTPERLKYLGRCGKLLVEFLGRNTRVSRLTDTDWLALLAGINHRHKSPFGRHSVVREIKLIFGMAQRRGWCPKFEYPPEFKAPGKAAKRRHKAEQIRERGAEFLSEEEIRKCLTVADWREQAAILCGVNFAMTCKDIVSLKFSDFDSDGFILKARAKTGEPLRAWRWERTKQAIDDYDARSRLPPSQQYRDFIFTGERHVPLTASSLSNNLQKVFKRSGIYRQGIAAC